MTVWDCVSVMLFFMIDSVTDSEPVIDCSAVPVIVKILKASNVFDSEGVSVTVGVNVFENSSLMDNVVVASLLRDWDNVSVYVAVRVSDSNSVFEGVSDFPSVGLLDRVFWSV